MNGSARPSDVSEEIVDAWVGHGLTRIDAWDGELGARSMSPPSFFALARPGNVGWVSRQVVRQASEARYGRSPVRLVCSTQIRALIRPAPEDLFETFFDTWALPALGLDRHELRLRPIEWRVRDLGITGSGWLVLADGVLVARFVEVGSLGSAPIQPQAVEITYGAERIALVASSHRSLARLQDDHSSAHGRHRRLLEQEHSRHLLEVLEDDELTRDLERELAAAERALGARLALPAYEAILRGIQCAEALRARGAFRTLREARAGRRLTELSSACRELAGSAPESTEDGRLG